MRSAFVRQVLGNPIEESHVFQPDAKFLLLFRGRVGVGQPGGTNGDSERFHQGFGCPHIAQAAQHLHELCPAELFLARADEVPGVERAQQAGVNRRRKIISAADRT